MSTATMVKKTVLDRRMDKIRALEESGKLATKLTNRTLRKVLSNKLAVLGAILFVVICILCFAAPLFTHWGPTQISLRDRMVSPWGPLPCPTTTSTPPSAKSTIAAAVLFTNSSCS